MCVRFNAFVKLTACCSAVAAGGGRLAAWSKMLESQDNASAHAVKMTVEVGRLRCLLSCGTWMSCSRVCSVSVQENGRRLGMAADRGIESLVRKQSATLLPGILASEYRLSSYLYSQRWRCIRRCTDQVRAGWCEQRLLLQPSPQSYNYTKVSKHFHHQLHRRCRRPDSARTERNRRNRRTTASPAYGSRNVGQTTRRRRTRRSNDRGYLRRAAAVAPAPSAAATADQDSGDVAGDAGDAELPRRPSSSYVAADTCSPGVPWDGWRAAAWPRRWTVSSRSRRAASTRHRVASRSLSCASWGCLVPSCASEHATRP